MIINEIFCKMIEHYNGDPRRINHFVKVHCYAKLIGTLENVDKKTQQIIEIAGLTHDIGIKISEDKYNSSAGKYQEQEGPAEARKLLEALHVEKDIVDRVCHLIGHHHSYNAIDAIDLQILIEADFIVNAYEDELPLKNILSLKERVFKTKSGTQLLEDIFKT